MKVQSVRYVQCSMLIWYSQHGSYVVQSIAEGTVPLTESCSGKLERASQKGIVMVECASIYGMSELCWLKTTEALQLVLCMQQKGFFSR